MTLYVFFLLTLPFLPDSARSQTNNSNSDRYKGSIDFFGRRILCMRLIWGFFFVAGNCIYAFNTGRLGVGMGEDMVLYCNARSNGRYPQSSHDTHVHNHVRCYTEQAWGQ